MSSAQLLLHAAGRRRSPAATPGFLCGQTPRNKGRQYPPDPPRPEEIILVMRQAGHSNHGLRVRALIAVLWRGGLRISEALALTETDVDQRRGALLIRHGKGDRRRESGMDDWGFEHLGAWLEHRVHMPVGPLFCVIDGSTCGRPWAATAARAELRRLAADAGVRRRFAPHQLRHAHAVELAREGVPVNIIQRQLGHADLGTTSTYVGDRSERDHQRDPRSSPADHSGHRRTESLAAVTLEYRWGTFASAPAGTMAEAGARPRFRSRR
jgi:integrase